MLMGDAMAALQGIGQPGLGPFRGQPQQQRQHPGLGGGPGMGQMETGLYEAYVGQGKSTLALQSGILFSFCYLMSLVGHTVAYVVYLVC